MHAEDVQSLVVVDAGALVDLLQLGVHAPLGGKAHVFLSQIA